MFPFSFQLQKADDIFIVEQFLQMFCIKDGYDIWTSEIFMFYEL